MGREVKSRKRLMLQLRFIISNFRNAVYEGILYCFFLRFRAAARCIS